MATIAPVRASSVVNNADDAGATGGYSPHKVDPLPDAVPDIANSPVNTWSSEETAKYLSDQGLDAMASNARSLDVDGATLQKLTLDGWK